MQKFFVTIAIILSVFLISCNKSSSFDNLEEKNTINMLNDMQVTIDKYKDNCDEMATKLNGFWEFYYPKYIETFRSLNDTSRTQTRSAIERIFQPNPTEDIQTNTQTNPPTAAQSSFSSEEVPFFAHLLFNYTEQITARGGRGGRGGMRRTSGTRRTSGSSSQRKNTSTAPQRTVSVVYIGGIPYRRQELTEEERHEFEKNLNERIQALRNSLGTCVNHEKIQSFQKSITASIQDETH